MTKRLSEVLTETERDIALDAFGLAFSIRVNRSLQASTDVPEYAKRPDEVVEQETSELQAELCELAGKHPTVIARMNLSMADLVTVQPISE
jgi:hypothetical protein